MQIYEKTLDDVKLANIEKPKIHRKNCIYIQLRMFFGQISPKFFISVKIFGLAQFETIIVPPWIYGGGQIPHFGRGSRGVSKCQNIDFLYKKPGKRNFSNT